MIWLTTQIRLLQRMVALPALLTLLLVIDLAAYFGGLLYWYGFVMAQPTTPLWAWVFIPDCPLFGLLSGLGLLMVTAQHFWGEAARVRAQRQLLLAGVAAALLWLATYWPAAPLGWRMQSAMLGVFSWSLLLSGVFFRKPPAWLLALFACGAIKYGVWTITAWLAFWTNTAAVYGAPLFTFDSVFMTVTHIGLLGQGILLLTYFKPTWRAALVCLAWFGLSDYVDYGVGYYPAIPLQFIPLALMQWSTIAMTLLLSAAMWLFSNYSFPFKEPKLAYSLSRE